MPFFKVKNVVDGDTFDVSQDWKWNGRTGDRVRPTGYDAPEIIQPGGQEAKRKLERLISGKQVELQSAKTLDRGRLVADVFVDGQYLADFFPEYKL